MTSPRTGFAYLDHVLDPPGSVLAFAHRGGSYHPDIEGLENTLAAFRHAVGLGYRYLETDVHVTRDGVLLAFHDLALDRVTDRRGQVADLTAAEVQEAMIGGRERVATLASCSRPFPTVASTSISSPRVRSPRWPTSSSARTPPTGCWWGRSRGRG